MTASATGKSKRSKMRLDEKSIILLLTHNSFLPSGYTDERSARTTDKEVIFPPRRRFISKSLGCSASVGPITVMFYKPLGDEYPIRLGNFRTSDYEGICLFLVEMMKHAGANNGTK